MFRNKESVLCLVVLVFCVTLTPALYHFSAVGCANVQFWWVKSILYSSQIYISDLKWGETGGKEGRTERGQRSVFTGLRPCLISHDTFVKQCVTRPPLRTHRLSGFLYLRDLFYVAFPPNLWDLLSINQKKWMKFDLAPFFLMWWHEKPWRVMCSLPSLIRPVCIPFLGSCGLSGALGIDRRLRGGSGIIFLTHNLEGEPGSAAQGQIIPWNLRGDEWDPGSQTCSKQLESSNEDSWVLEPFAALLCRGETG